MSENSTGINIGGSLEKALAGDYKLKVSAILQEAYHTTMRTRLSINLGLLFACLLGLFVTQLVANQLGGIEAAFADPQASFILNAVVTLVVYPFLVSVEMMGVYHAVGLQTKPSLIFAFLKKASSVALCALMVWLLMMLGFQLIVPGLYLAVALSLVLPLLIEKQLSPIKAIVISLKATRFQWFAMFQLYLLLTLALIVAVLPLVAVSAFMPNFMVFGAGVFIFILSYLAPLFYHVKGILYREIFGITLHASAQINNNDDVFTA